jgi:hypothetical protein
MIGAAAPSEEPSIAGNGLVSDRPDWRRTLQLVLATLWLLDGVLQLQPFFFASGPNGLGGMLDHTASGNPGWIADTLTWNASVVAHHSIATNAAFASIQILLGLGIACRRTIKPALAFSVAWSLLVWWFGEGLGGLFNGTGSPLGGGPGAVLFYGLLAIVLWPVDRARPDRPYVAAGSLGETGAKWVWAVVWCGLAALMVGTSYTARSVSNTVARVDTGQPSWLTSLDRHVTSLVGHQGLAVALALAVVFLLVGVAIFLPDHLVRPLLVVALVVGLGIWVIGENFGMILPGGGTDPNSGPLLMLFVLCYWPARRSLATRPAVQPATTDGVALEAAT